jgi:hypothetical protein
MESAKKIQSRRPPVGRNNLPKVNQSVIVKDSRKKNSLSLSRKNPRELSKTRSKKSPKQDDSDES